MSSSIFITTRFNPHFGTVIECGNIVAPALVDPRREAEAMAKHIAKQNGMRLRYDNKQAVMTHHGRCMEFATAAR
jgi:hypothetical protein